MGVDSERTRASEKKNKVIILKKAEEKQMDTLTLWGEELEAELLPEEEIETSKKVVPAGGLGGGSDVTIPWGTYGAIIKRC